MLDMDISEWRCVQHINGVQNAGARLGARAFETFESF